MRVLHLFSNWKLTGPAEPALNIASECAGLGIESRFFCGRVPEGDEAGIVNRARERGLEVETPLVLSKHWRPIRNFLDARSLREILADWKPDILHCHADNDTRIGLSAARRLPKRPIVLRTSYSGSPEDMPPSELYALRRVDAIIAVSQRVAQSVATDHSISSDRVSHIPTGVDLKRFTPDNAVRDLREEWKIAEGAPVIGVVARIQAKRRFDILFEGFKQYLEIRPDATLVVVGRGTRKKQVGEIPVRKMGISDRVLFPGYLEGNAYVEALWAFDVLVYLVPGTDGSCRTVREAMVMGVPVISSRRGILLELVQDGVNGYTVNEDPQALREAMSRILESREDLRRMGVETKRKAQDRFALARQGVSTKNLYDRLVGDR
jgi:glycosyltransferase involved in cell wall biosynthesis